MSTNVASIQPHQAAEIVEGYVKGGCNNRWVVEMPTGLKYADKAFSCMVEPQSGDKVLVSSSGNTGYILAVLERSDPDMTLNFPGNVELRTDAGAVQVKASDRVSISAVNRLDLVSAHCDISASRTDLTNHQLRVTSESVEAKTGSVKWFGKRLDSVVNRITQHAQYVMRNIEGVETLNAGNLLQTVRNSLSVRSNHATITSKKDMRIDGERIHMG